MDLKPAPGLASTGLIPWSHPPAPWSLAVTPAWPGPVPKCLCPAQHSPGESHPCASSWGGQDPWAPEHSGWRKHKSVQSEVCESCQAAFRARPSQRFQRTRQSWPLCSQAFPSSDTLSARCPSSPDPRAHGAAYSWPPASHTHRGVFGDGTLSPPPLSSLTWQPQDPRRRPTPPSVGETGVFKLCFSETSCSWPS